MKERIEVSKYQTSINMHDENKINLI